MFQRRKTDVLRIFHIATFKFLQPNLEKSDTPLKNPTELEKTGARKLKHFLQGNKIFVVFYSDSRSNTNTDSTEPIR